MPSRPQSFSELDPAELPLGVPADVTLPSSTDDDDRDDEKPDENEIPIGEVDDATEAPEEFETDDEDALASPDDADDLDDDDDDDLDDDGNDDEDVA